MTATLSWLDTSDEQQRRVREMIRLFEEPGTQDELGISSVRDTLSEMLFPGTSTLQTRARYFFFVPWHFEAAASRGVRGQAMLDRVHQQERLLISRFKAADQSNVGLVGRVAGARVKILPSTIYWGGLSTWGILRFPMNRYAVAALAGEAKSNDDEDAERTVGAWHPTLPLSPDRFPDADSGGFDLTYEEATWLTERLQDRLNDTLLTYLTVGDDIIGASFAWEEPSVSEAPPGMRAILEHARKFSVLINGAALLHNLLVAEAYETAGLTQVESPVDSYRDLLATWSADNQDVIGLAWDWPAFWETVIADGGARVHPAVRLFVENWIEHVRAGDSSKVAHDQTARSLVRDRVTNLRGQRTALCNPKLLGMWGGATGASPLDYRWLTVRQIIADIQEGRARV